MAQTSNTQIQPLLDALFSGSQLSQDQSASLFDLVMTGQLSDMQLAAALIAMKVRGETPEEIAGAAAAMRKNAIAFDRPSYDFIDSCGTGGDGSNTINISTTAAIVAAACGVKVAKHGNRSVSSKSGSSDLLNALGIKLDMTPDVARKCLDEVGVTFLFAPQYHSGVKHAMPVRTGLKTRTLFNLLGPLANPAAPNVQLMGVYDENLLATMATTLGMLGVERAMVVNGSGLDEVAIHAPTRVAELKDGQVTEYTISPSDFGLETYPLEAIKGGEPEENAAATKAILTGNGTAAHNAAIAINVAPVLVMLNLADSFKQAAKHVLDVLSSGKANDTLSAFAQLSHS